jgi:hypothetical protein
MSQEYPPVRCRTNFGVCGKSIATVLAMALCLSSCSTKDPWQKLFNGKDLQGWDTYIGPVYDTIKNAFDTTRVLGLNHDVNKIFSIVNEDGQPAIRVSGENFGGVSTTDEFRNYHLQLQFKWGEKRWNPKKGKKRDSGVLYHAGGKHGVDAGSWMRSQEFQVQEGDTGDYWGVAGASFEVPVSRRGEGYVYNPSGERLTFNNKSKVGRRVIKLPDAERPTGQWNTIDIYCLGDTAVHIVNGQVNLILYHSSQPDGDKLKRLDHGKIQIQSEGAEVYYRDIQLEKINAIPDAIVHHKYDPTWGMDFD